MLSFYLVWMLIYFLLLSELAKFWPERSCETKQVQVFPKVSVLIPCRNESENIHRLAGEFKRLHYPNLELIFVDDHSEDDTYELIEAAACSDLRIVPLRSPGEGKKAALEFAIDQANGEIILCSDADCSFPENWVKGMVSQFDNQEIQLVAGPVIVTDNGRFLGAFQQADWASNLLVSAYFFSKSKPLMCSGANLAYRKSAFLDVLGYEGNRDFSSGDDEFLLKKIVKKYGASSCVYLPFVENLVQTKPEPNWKAFINQRVRWAGKWKAHRSYSHAVSAVFSFLAQLVWMGSFGLLTLGSLGILIFGMVWTSKILAEKRSLGKVLRIFGIKHRKIEFVLTSFIHPIYVLAVGLGAIQGNFTWKGRRNSRSD
ncbi:MAG: glycosyltransferase [Algoriphagus sp.]|nr:glycosyltransferase [Algoriphagus sp.]